MWILNLFHSKSIIIWSSSKSFFFLSLYFFTYLWYLLIFFIIIFRTKNVSIFHTLYETFSFTLRAFFIVRYLKLLNHCIIFQSVPGYLCIYAVSHFPVSSILPLYILFFLFLCPVIYMFLFVSLIKCGVSYTRYCIGFVITNVDKLFLVHRLYPINLIVYKC